MIVRERRGANLSAVVNLLAALAALAAVVSAGWVVSQWRTANQQALLSASLTLLDQLDDRWNSDTMLDVRSSAAAGLLAGDPTPDLRTVLDFFRELALLVRRGAVDEEFAAIKFYSPLAAYWSASREYVQRSEEAKGQPAALEQLSELEELTKRLGAAEAARRHVQPADLLPSKDEVTRFLESERSDEECDDDTPVRAEPL